MYSLSSALFKSNALRMVGRISEVRNVKMKVRPYQRRYETIVQKNLRRKLPMSPALGIYQPQITTILSISHRISGISLAMYTTLFGLRAIFSSHEFSHIVTMVEGLELTDVSLLVMRIVLVFPFAFHVCTGLRHLLWASGKGLTIKEVYTTGYASIVGTLVLAGLLAVI